MYDSIEEDMQEIPGVLINKTKRKIVYEKSELIVFGLKTNTKQKGLSAIKTGMRSAKGADYIIIAIDEAYEVNQDDYNALIEAVRGSDHILVIRIANPWSIKNDFIKYCNSYLPFSKKEKNNYEDTFHIEDKKLFHYPSYKDNKFLRGWEVEKLEELLSRDPKRAIVSVLGMPGIIKGAIYEGYYEKIKVVPKGADLPVSMFKGGIDWGIKHSSTAANFHLITPNNRSIRLSKGYTHNNEQMTFKDNPTMIKEILYHIEDLGDKYPAMVSMGLHVKVDNAAWGIIDMISSEAQKMGLTWVQFDPSIKYEINTRIDVFRLAMSLEKFWDMEDFESPNYEPLRYEDENDTLKEELEISQWDPDKQLERLNENDHHINAWEYAHDEIMFQMIDGYEEDLTHEAYTAYKISTGKV